MHSIFGKKIENLSLRYILAEYAIATPSIEMFLESYNQVTHTVNNNNGEKLEAIYIDYSNEQYSNGSWNWQGGRGYIYTIGGELVEGIYAPGNSTNWKTVDNMGYNRMYGPGEYTGNLFFMWFASPNAGENNSLCRCKSGALDCYGRLTSGGNYPVSSNWGICPIVCLKSDFLPQILE